MKKEQKKLNVKAIFVVILIISATGYFYVTQPSGKERYTIKGSDEDGGWRASFINITGKNAEDKKIGLSDDYWSSGKFK